MPKSSAGKRSSDSSTTRSGLASSEREPRGARRKRETRQRLLEAALKLMAARGMEGVTINEITEAADVGFGSFYNHFASREAIYAALVRWAFEDYADERDRLLSDVSDPAEVISVNVRHALLRARREPLWGQFLTREGLSPRAMQHGLGLRLLRDVQMGIATKRFTVADPLVSFITMGSTVLGAIVAELQFDSPQAAALKELGFNGEKIPERIAAALLQMLGVGRAEAERIANRPLPTEVSQLTVDVPGARQDAVTTRSTQSGVRRSK